MRSVRSVRCVHTEAELESVLSISIHYVRLTRKWVNASIIKDEGMR